MEQQVLAMDVRQLEKLNALQDADAPNLVADMARGFLTRTPLRIDKMPGGAARGEADQLAHEAHGLATSCGMFGMMRMRLHCKALENLARGPGWRARGSCCPWWNRRSGRPGPC